MYISNYSFIINEIGELDDALDIHTKNFTTITKGMNELLDLTVDLINALNHTNKLLEENNIEAPQYDLNRILLRLERLPR